MCVNACVCARSKERVCGRVQAMMKETEAGAGGVQGLSFVKDQLMVDEDGDEAMEFFEVTDEGLRKRNIPNAQPAK